MFTVTFKTTSN